MKISLINIEKKYHDEILFRNLNYTFENPSYTALLGINGSGKSTLLQMIAGYITPSKGEIQIIENEKIIEQNNYFHYLSLCAPSLEIIEEMTLIELLEYHFKFKKNIFPIQEMINYIGLENTNNKLIEKFSSGMKQRVKLALAFFSDVPILLLDEPCTNLDEQGIKLYLKMIEDFTKNRIVIVASNNESEYAFCEKKFFINKNN